MPPTRFGHIRTSSVQAGAAAQLRTSPDDEQRHGRAALPRDGALSDKQGGDQEDHLIAAAHGKGGRADPPEHSWMRPRAQTFANIGSHRQPSAKDDASKQLAEGKKIGKNNYRTVKNRMFTPNIE
jgi:hypothetical protein